MKLNIAQKKLVKNPFYFTCLLFCEALCFAKYFVYNKKRQGRSGEDVTNLQSG